MVSDEPCRVDQGRHNRLKLGKQKSGLLWRAREREPMGIRGGKAPPRSWRHFSMSTRFCAVLELVVVADLAEATRQRRTFGTAAILSVND